MASDILPYTLSKFFHACFQSCSGMVRGMLVAARWAFSRVSTSFRMRAVSKAPAIREISSLRAVLWRESDSRAGESPMSARYSRSCSWAEAVSPVPNEAKSERVVTPLE